jgi:6-phosphogluconolactonase
MYSIISAPTPEQLTRQVASLWLDEIQSAQAKQRPFRVALSGGRVAKALFEATRSEAESRKMSWNGVEFFWVDERCVPPEDPESNYKTAHEILLGPCKIAPDRVHRIAGELDPATAAALAEATIKSSFGGPTEDTPSLDLVILGMGEDGHIASLFPNASPDVVNSSECYIPVVGPKPPPKRITLTYKALVAAKRAWVIIAGSQKDVAWSESVGDKRSTPLARLLSLRNETLIAIEDCLLRK